MPPRVLVVGSINLDLVVRVLKLPKPGETVHGDAFVESPGGKGANQAVAAAWLGAQATMIGRIGDDAFGQKALVALSRASVNIDHVLITRGCSSGVALINVEASGQNAITVIPGANACVTPDDVQELEDLFRVTDAVLVQLEIPLSTVVATCSLARKHGALIVFDPAPAPNHELPNELYAADLICPNQIEAEALTGIAVTTPANALAAAALLSSRGAKQTVIKLGKQGAFVCDSDCKSMHVPAPQVNAIDTTAAGDAFQAALAVALIEGQSLFNATRFACAAGALATTKHGAQQAMPTRGDLEQLLSAVW
jgi:ribokinase